MWGTDFQAPRPTGSVNQSSAEMRQCKGKTLALHAFLQALRILVGYIFYQNKLHGIWKWSAWRAVLSRRGPFLACMRKIQLGAQLLFARRGALWALSLWKLCEAEPFFKLSLVQGSSALPLRQNLVPKLISKILPAVVEALHYRPCCCICLHMLSRRYLSNSLGYGTLVFFHCVLYYFILS